MKLLREFCELVEESPTTAVGILLFCILTMLLGLCAYSERLNHERKMELLKQGKVSIESIK